MKFDAGLVDMPASLDGAARANGAVGEARIERLTEISSS